MCTRITYNFGDTVNAFNFDMDLTLWSYRLFKDNERFGIVYVDYSTGERIKKDSFEWYRCVIAQKGANL